MRVLALSWVYYFWRQIPWGLGVVLSRGGGGGGGGEGVRPENKYRGVRELLFIPKKGGLENKHRPKVVVGEGAGGGVSSLVRGVWGPHPEMFGYLDALWCNLRHFEPKYKSSKITNFLLKINNFTIHGE